MKTFESYHIVSFFIIYFALTNSSPLTIPHLVLPSLFLQIAAVLPVLALIFSSNTDSLEHLLLICSYFSFIRSFSSPKLTSSTSCQKPLTLDTFIHGFFLASILILMYNDIIPKSYISLSYVYALAFSSLYIISKNTTLDFVLQDYAFIHLIFFFTKK